LKHDLPAFILFFEQNQIETRKVMMKSKVNDESQKFNKKVESAIEEIAANQNRESRLAMIQMLIPLGLKAVEYELQGEVQGLVGNRYSRGNDYTRWGSNAGSVFLGDQKVSIRVPRVRHKVKLEEIQLQNYISLQDPGVIDDIVLKRVINGIAQGKYEKAAIQVPETFGIKKTSVCRRFIKTTEKQLREFQERDLSSYDIVAIFMDGKTFAENSIVVALGITMEGDKIILGFVETSTENHVVCHQFITGLKDRGLNTDKEILFIIDGGKGLRKGIKKVLGEKAVIQRCQWHKREDVLGYLSKEKRPDIRRKMQNAYEQPTYAKAKAKLDLIRKELIPINESAVNSLDEGLEETLTLHRLGVFTKIGTSFKTTNCIENINKQIARYTDRVDRWKNSNQRQRWVATSMIQIEPGLRKVKGHKFLRELRQAMGALKATEKAVAA
jgi:putative transposase